MLWVGGGVSKRALASIFSTGNIQPTDSQCRVLHLTFSEYRYTKCSIPQQYAFTVTATSTHGFMQRQHMQVAKWRSVHSKLPLLEIATLSLLTSGTQLLLPFVGTCQPCVETAHPPRMRSMHPSFSLASAMDPFLPQAIFGPDGLLGRAPWGSPPDSKFEFESATQQRMLSMFAADTEDAAPGSSGRLHRDPLYATIIDEDNILDQEEFPSVGDLGNSDKEGDSYGLEVQGEVVQPPGAGKWHPHHSTSGVSTKTCAPYLQRTRSLLMYSKCPASTYNDIGVLVFSEPNQVT